MSDAQTTTVTLTQVVSVAPTAVADTDMVLSLSRRSTTENPVKTEERYRAIVVNRSLLALPDGCTISKFERLLQATIYDLADKKFGKWAVENIMAREVDSSLFNLDAVMTYWAEAKRAAQIDAAKVIDFLKASVTFKALDEKKQAIWLNKVPKIAAPSYTNIFTKGEAAAIVAKLHADDLEHPIAVFIATRCNAVITKESQEEAL